jgi:hypothetical protein
MNWRTKIKTCLRVLRGETVIFNANILGKVRIKLVGKDNFFIQDNKFLDDIVTDKVFVIPDDLAKHQIKVNHV